MASAVGVRRLEREVAGVEAVREAGLGEQLRARLGSYGGLDGRANSMRRGTTLPVSPRNPRNSASLMAFRSRARLAASRTRRSAHGDFGSHCSGNSREKLAFVRDGDELEPWVRLTSSATGPLRKYAMSTSPFLRAAARVVSSGMLLNTSRFTLGALRQ